MAKQYRQGHILLNPEPVPAEATRITPAKENHVVLATGETGREHVFKSERVGIFQSGPDLYIEVTGEGDVALEHPEHGHIEVEPGTYRLVEQVEADPITRASRASFD